MKDKPTDLIERGTKAGCETVQDFAMWINGYEAGVDDMKGEVIKEITRPFPDHYNAAIAEGEKNRRQELKERKERHADYSDQGD